jgi:hypothetical protein
LPCFSATITLSGRLFSDISAVPSLGSRISAAACDRTRGQLFRCSHSG